MPIGWMYGILHRSSNLHDNGGYLLQKDITRRTFPVGTGLHRETLSVI